MSEFNPYAPPPAVDVTPRIRRHRPQKYIFLVCFVSAIVLPIVSRPDRPLTFMGIEWAGPILLLGVIFGMFASWATWTYGTWRMVPQAFRGSISPGVSLLFYFVPGLNLWWAFAYNRRVVRALDDALRSSQTPLGTPRLLAWIAPAFFLVFCLAFAILAAAVGPNTRTSAVVVLAIPASVSMFVAPLTLFAWMFRVDHSLEATSSAAPAVLA